MLISWFALQLHLVHWDTENFKSFGEAAGVRGGLAVLGMFLKVISRDISLLLLSLEFKLISIRA